MGVIKPSEQSNECRESDPAADVVVDAPAAHDEPETLDSLRAQVQALREQNLRAVAEQRNQQDRARRELAEQRRYAEQGIARELLIVLDDLERTQASAGEDAVDVQTVAEGVRLVYDKLLKVLEDRRIEPIESVGRAFDPDQHEAVLQQPSAEFEAGVVMQELARGYRMHDRVIRAAKVIVSSGCIEGKE